MQNGSYLFLTLKHWWAFGSQNLHKGLKGFFLAGTFYGRCEMLVYIITLLLFQILMTHTAVSLREAYKEIALHT